MSYWDSNAQKVIHRPSAPWDGYPGWLREDCSCCNGLEWGGEYPRECHDCGGNGFIAVHVESGLVASWPGGPCLGSMGKSVKRPASPPEAP